MSNITINIKILAGTDIDTAIKEAKNLATNLDVAYVYFNFNGTKMSIGQNADTEKVIKQYFKRREDYIVES